MRLLGRAARHRLARLRAVLLVAAGLLGIGVGLFASTAGPLERLELDTVDARFSLRGTEPPPPDLAVVAIDTKTFDVLNRQFPWERRLHGRVFRNLKRDGARVLAFDVQITEPSQYGKADDFALYNAARAAKPVVFATTEVGDGGRHFVFGGEKNLRKVGGRAAHAQLPNDPRGVVRRIPYEVDGLPSLAVATVAAAERRMPPRPDGGGRDGAWYVDFHGPTGTIPTFSYADVLRGRFRAGTFKDRIVIVGPTAPTLQDVHNVSVGGEEPMPGAEVQANAVSTVRSGFPLRVAGRGWRVAAIVALSLIIPLLCLWRGARFAVLAGAIVTAGYLFASKVLFDFGTIVAVVPPVFAVVAASTATVAAQYATEVRERRRLRVLFGRFVPESVVDDVVRRADDDLRLGGERLEATVLFSDLRGFTSYAERLDPQEVIETLNVYLGEMSDAILGAGGTLVAYMGDGIMAVFGAPITLDDHADRAMRAALEMLGPRLERFNGWIGERGGKPFRMGVGLNSGAVMSGNVGSERRVEYTAVGDTTNTAARLEAMTKGTPYQLMLSETTRERLSASPQELEDFGDVEVRGRTTKLKVWGLPDAAIPLLHDAGVAGRS